jgi:hypothetical protein
MVRYHTELGSTVSFNSFTVTVELIIDVRKSLVTIISIPKETLTVYHRERILETSTLSCNEEEEEITKPPKR